MCVCACACVCVCVSVKVGEVDVRVFGCLHFVRMCVCVHARARDCHVCCVYIDVVCVFVCVFVCVCHACTFICETSFCKIHILKRAILIRGNIGTLCAMLYIYVCFLINMQMCICIYTYIYIYIYIYMYIFVCI